MNSSLKLALTAVLLTSLSGCTATHRNSQIMGPNGLAERTVAALDNTRHSDHIRRFLSFAEEASRIGFARNQSRSTANATDGALWNIDLSDNYASPQNQERIHRFMHSGFSLIRENCRDYFWALGNQQRGANVLRDSVGPITALISGILNIISPGGGMDNSGATSNDTLGFITVGSVALASTLDIYEERFLFGADNVVSVGNLVQQALGTHSRVATYGSNPETAAGRLTLTYETAATRLRENQELCTPGNVLLLTRQAIAAARPQPINRPADPGSGDDEGEEETIRGGANTSGENSEPIQVGIPTPQ